MADLKAKPYNLNEKQIEWVYETLSKMTVEDKVGQLFCEIVNSAEEVDMDRIFSKVKPGSIMFRPLSLERTLEIVRDLQTKSDIPMLIAGNLERGGNGACLEGTYYGAPMQVAATGDEKCGYELGLIAGREGIELSGIIALLLYNLSDRVTSSCLNKRLSVEADVIAYATLSLRTVSNSYHIVLTSLVGCDISTDRECRNVDGRTA